MSWHPVTWHHTYDDRNQALGASVQVVLTQCLHNSQYPGRQTQAAYIMAQAEPKRLKVTITKKPEQGTRLHIICSHPQPRVTGQRWCLRYAEQDVDLSRWKMQAAACWVPAGPANCSSPQHPQAPTAQCPQMACSAGRKTALIPAVERCNLLESHVLRRWLSQSWLKQRVINIRPEKFATGSGAEPAEPSRHALGALLPYPARNNSKLRRRYEGGAKRRRRRQWSSSVKSVQRREDHHRRIGRRPCARLST
jgi:hypothetical protein